MGVFDAYYGNLTDVDAAPSMKFLCDASEDSRRRMLTYYIKMVAHDRYMTEAYTLITGGNDLTNRVAVEGYSMLGFIRYIHEDEGLDWYTDYKHAKAEGHIPLELRIPPIPLKKQPEFMYN